MHVDAAALPASLPVATALRPELLAALTELGQQLQGSVELHDTTTHQQAGGQTVWNELLKSDTPAFQAAQPLCWVRCASQRDAALAMAFVVRHRLKVSCRGGGHQYAGVCMADGGVVLDLSRLKAVQVDGHARTARIEAGLTTQELREATITHGLHFPGGHISSVGCGGFILGGGMGWGLTKWGAAADNVFGFEVILPGGSSPVADPNPNPSAAVVEGGPLAPLGVTHVTAQSDPELFAALRGAGMYVGVVVAFHVRLHAVPSMLRTITAVYPLHAAPKVVALMQDIVCQGPGCVEPSVLLVRDKAPGHPPMVVLGATAFAEADDSDVMATFARVHTLLPGEGQVKEECLPYLQALAILDAGYVGPRLCVYAHGMFVEHASFTPTLVESLMHAAATVTSHRSFILLVPSTPKTAEPSSLDFRGMLYVNSYAMWHRTEAGPTLDGDQAHVQWVRGLCDAVGTAAVGTYINEVMLEPGHLASSYTPATLAKVTRVKARTDPWGLLRSLDA